MERTRPDLFSGILPFVRVAEELSFQRAAAGLGISTAAVSKAIRKLEGELGVSLFARSSRAVSLTREGAAFFERCLPAVRGVQGAREAVHATRRAPQGELAVTLSFILVPFVTPRLVHLAAEHPRLTFRLHASDRVARLSDESFDVALRTGALPPSSHVARLLRRTRWVTVAAPSYLARHAPPRHPGELARHNALRFLGPTGKPTAWSFTNGAVDVSGNLLVDHGPELVTAARSGLGIAQVLDFMVNEDLRTGALVEVLGAHATRGPDVHALTTAAKARSASVRAFIAFAVESFR